MHQFQVEGPGRHYRRLYFEDAHQLHGIGPGLCLLPNFDIDAVFQ